MLNQKEKRMNILVLMSDQHRKEITSCYGHPIVKTPNIDRIAKRGIRYNNAYCASPLCGPSRTAFLTGTYPNKNWSVTHANKRYRTGEEYQPPINPDTPSLVTLLQNQGYYTFGTGYLGAAGSRDGKPLSPNDFGFSHWSNSPSSQMTEDALRQYHLNGIQGEMWEPNYQNVTGNTWNFDNGLPFDSHVANRTCRFLDEYQKDQPFIAYAGFRAPHPPWVPPKKFRDLYDSHNVIVPDYKIEYKNKPRRVMERLSYYDCRYYPEEVVRESIASYYGFVSYMDDCIGQILDKLEELELSRNTLIIYASDHGELLYNNGLCEKHTLFEGAVNIPLIISKPGLILEEQISDCLVDNTDILPTILALNNIAIPEYCDGVDLRPTFDGQSVKQEVFSEYYHTLDPCRMIRRGKYKYIHTVDDINELYDLENDPLEEYNLAFYPQYKELCDELDALVLRDWDIPEIPLCAPWNDLNERKQRQLQENLPIKNFRPAPPEWVVKLAD